MVVEGGEGVSCECESDGDVAGELLGVGGEEAVQRALGFEEDVGALA